MSTVAVGRDQALSPIAGSSAAKALGLLRLIAEDDNGAVRLSDLADAVDLPKSTTHRLLKALEVHGFVGRDGSRYCVGNGVFKLLESVRWSRYGTLREEASDALSWLFTQCKGTVHLGVLDHGRVLYVDKISNALGSRMPSRIGTNVPVTCTALGKALLAFSPPADIHAVVSKPLEQMTPYSIRDPRLLVEELLQVHGEGVAREVDEAMIGVACVAAPVMVSDTAVAAVSVSFPSRDNGRTNCAGPVRRAAAMVAERLAADL